MTRKVLVTICSFLLFLACSTMAMGAEKRLGYGFEEGLVPGKDFVAGQLIVGLEEGMGIQGLRGAMLAAGIYVAKEKEGALLLQFASEQEVMEAVSVLLQRPDVAFVERNGFLRVPPRPTIAESRCGTCDRAVRREMGALSVSTDVLNGYQWHLTVIRKTAKDLGTLTASPPMVAVIDTGVDYSHPDLSGRVVSGKNFVADTMDPMDDNGHGTHVAGIIGARASNGDYGEGVCPYCRILAVKVLGSDGSGSFFDVAQGMQYARTYTNASYPPVKVINMSLGGPSSAAIAAEVLAIKNAGKALVASAGNDNSSTTLSYPGADANTAFRVMATDEADCRAWFSNFSPSSAPTRYNIAAPGWRIYSTLPSGGFDAMDGTSMAAPVVAGTAALIWGQLPTLTRNQLVSRIVNNGKSTSCGFAAATRRVDLRKGLLAAPETGIMGGVVDPFSGKAPSPPTTSTYVRLYSGTTQLAYDITTRGGVYEMTGLAAGSSRTLKGERTGYINAILRDPVTISSGIMAGPFVDALPQARGTGYATIILDWKTTQPVVSTTGCTGSCLGWEFDLSVKTPSGTYIHPSSNPGDLMTSPYVKSPRDSYNDLLKMETIVVAPSAGNGIYRIFVDKPTYSGEWNPSWTGSGASVQAFSAAAPLSGYYSAPPTACGSSYRYWHVGNLTKSGTSYTWTNVNTCTNTKP